ncbi:hypothetical protein [Azospirillum sp. ST 5-10]|uniref:hypothetical protein n=1 Tax=unclassified Azospirillum TaxID=2630922 RepID=UPI003F49E9A4
MQTATGTIVLVQEGRFRLATDGGPSRLFVLSHGADLEPQDLPALQHAQARVAVRYEDLGTLGAAVAHHVTPLGRSR